MTFRTTLCDLLGIDYPIVQSGMGAIASAILACVDAGDHVVARRALPRRFGKSLCRPAL